MDELLKLLGLMAIVVPALGVSLKPFLERWIGGRIDAGIQEGLQKRLSQFRLDLDKELERHKAALAVQSEQLRSQLNRETIDYGLYANRRHEAVAALFAEFLRAELLLQDMTDLSIRPAKELTYDSLDVFLKAAEATPAEAEDLRNAYERADFNRVDRWLRDLVQSARNRRATKARNDAYEAYFRYALYLPAAVDAAAGAVRDFFHTAALPFILPGDPDAGPLIVRNKVRLRFLITEYMNAARNDLARGVIVRDAPAQHAVAAGGDDAA